MRFYSNFNNEFTKEYNKDEVKILQQYNGFIAINNLTVFKNHENCIKLFNKELFIFRLKYNFTIQIKFNNLSFCIKNQFCNTHCLYYIFQKINGDFNDIILMYNTIYDIYEKYKKEFGMTIDYFEYLFKTPNDAKRYQKYIDNIRKKEIIYG
jgi:hypothetical protein